MSILDKKLFLSDLQAALDNYIPANMVKKIIADAGSILTGYEVAVLPGGGDGKSENAQLLKLYLDAKEIEGLSTGTINRYSYAVGRMLQEINGPATKMTVYHLRQYIMGEKERGVSMNTIKGNVSTYNGFFGWLQREGIIQANPVNNIGNIKAKPEEELPFTAEEIQLIKEACTNDRHRAMVHFLLSTGCRVSEMCAVNRADVDYTNMRLQVTGKGNKTRWVYIDDVTAMMLKRYIAKREDICPALFIGRCAKRATPENVRKILNGIGERAHVPKVHPHRFRHTLATNLIDRGMSIEEVSTILGHSRLDTTMIYVSVNQKNTEHSYRRHACM